MGRSNSNGIIVSGESVSGSSTYIPNYSSVPGHHQNLLYSQTHHHSSSSGGGGGLHHLPSPPLNHHHHHGQYLNHLANAANYYEANNNSNGSGNNNVTPPARVYSPLSHGSNSSTGSSVLSYVSGGGGGIGESNNNNGTLTIVESGNCVKYEFEDFPQEPDGGPVKTGTWKDHVAVFNIDQVGVMCDVLLQEGDLSRLVDLLSTIAKDFMGRSEKILRAQAHVAFHAALEDARKFPQVYKVLETNSFSLQYHGGLQKLWFNAHYKEAEITRGRPLGAVDKYRIRRKFPLPRTIWDGEETVYCFKERSRNSLRESFKLEKYPNLEEKKKLSKETGLTMTQVGNWFKNKRQREKEKEQGKAVTKRHKTAYNSPVGLGAMTPDILGMMLSNGGGVGLNQVHLPSHHHHHQPHSSFQQHLAPMSPEDFENAIRKARLVDEAHRIKSYIDDGISSNPVSGQYHHSNNGSMINNSAANGESCNQNGSPPPRQLVIHGKSDNTIGVVPSPVGPNGQHQHQHQQHHHHLQQPSPKSNSGLTITAVPSPTSDGHIHQLQHSPCESNGNGMDMEGSPGSTGGGGGELYGIGRAKSNTSSTAGVRCGADLVPYLQAAGHHHHHNSTYPAHHHHLQGHHHHHSSLGSPLPPRYDVGVSPLIHNNSAASALSHA